MRALLGLAVAGVLTLAVGREIVYGTLERVKDGDTFLMRIHGVDESIRIFGIDTPEKFNSSKLDRDVELCKVTREVMREAGKEATQYAKEHLHPGEKYRLELMEGTTHGRLIGWVYLPGEKVYNVEVVRDGYAVVYRTYTKKYPEKDRELMKAIQYARSHKTGLWAKYPAVMECMYQRYTLGNRHYTPESHQGLPKGVKIGLAIASILVLGGLLLFFLRREG